MSMKNMPGGCCCGVPPGPYWIMGTEWLNPPAGEGFEGLPILQGFYHADTIVKKVFCQDNASPQRFVAGDYGRNAISPLGAAGEPPVVMAWFESYNHPELEYNLPEYVGDPLSIRGSSWSLGNHAAINGTFTLVADALTDEEGEEGDPIATEEFYIEQTFFVPSISTSSQRPRLLRVYAAEKSPFGSSVTKIRLQLEKSGVVWRADYDLSAMTAVGYDDDFGSPEAYIAETGVFSNVIDDLNKNWRELRMAMPSAASGESVTLKIFAISGIGNLLPTYEGREGDRFLLSSASFTSPSWPTPYNPDSSISFLRATFPQGSQPAITHHYVDAQINNYSDPLPSQVNGSFTTSWNVSYPSSHDLEWSDGWVEDFPDIGNVIPSGLGRVNILRASTHAHATIHDGHAMGGMSVDVGGNIGNSYDNQTLCINRGLVGSTHDVQGSSLQYVLDALDKPMSRKGYDYNFEPSGIGWGDLLPIDGTWSYRNYLGTEPDPIPKIACWYRRGFPNCAAVTDAQAKTGSLPSPTFAGSTIVNDVWWEDVEQTVEITSGEATATNETFYYTNPPTNVSGEHYSQSGSVVKGPSNVVFSVSHTQSRRFESATTTGQSANGEDKVRFRYPFMDANSGDLTTPTPHLSASVIGADGDSAGGHIILARYDTVLVSNVDSQESYSNGENRVVLIHDGVVVSDTTWTVADNLNSIYSPNYTQVVYGENDYAYLIEVLDGATKIHIIKSGSFVDSITSISGGAAEIFSTGGDYFLVKGFELSDRLTYTFAGNKTTGPFSASAWYIKNDLTVQVPLVELESGYDELDFSDTDNWPIRRESTNAVSKWVGFVNNFDDYDFAPARSEIGVMGAPPEDSKYPSRIPV